MGKKAAVAVDASQWTDWQQTDESPSTIARLRPRWRHHHDEPLRPLGHTPIGPAWGHWEIPLGVHGHLPSLKMIQLDFLLAKLHSPHSNSNSHSLAARMQMIYTRLMQIYRWFEFAACRMASQAKKVINTESTWREHGLLCSTCPAWAWTWPIFWRPTRKELWLGRGVTC